MSALAEVLLGPVNVGATSVGAVPLLPVELLLLEQLATTNASIKITPMFVNFLNIEIPPFCINILKLACSQHQKIVKIYCPNKCRFWLVPSLPSIYGLVKFSEEIIL